MKIPDSQQPRKRRSALRRVFLSFLLLGLLSGVMAAAAGLYGFAQFTKSGPLAEAKVLEIEKGLRTPEIGVALESGGIISDARLFTLAAIATGMRGRLKAGEYEFPKGASMRDVMQLLESGKSIVYRVSIPEGWTSQMAMARIAEHPSLTGDITLNPAEGAIMPDTYLFRRGMSRDRLISEMTGAQSKLLDELWSKRNPSIPLKTPEEAVVLASIVEKETAIPEERPKIASVFLNRLARGMRLQSDPTIIYGIAGGKGRLDRPLTKADIAEATPYNTYRIDGLPPGPIANPGRASLEAVLNPLDTKLLYFVADGSGGHAFAETLEEHNRNVANWRQLGRMAGEAASDDESETPPAETVQAEQTAAIDQPASAPLPDVSDIAQPEQDQSEAEAEAPATVASAEANAAATASTTQAAAIPIPKPPEKPAQRTSDAASPAENAPEPGSVITLAGRLVPIPRQKPAVE